MEEYLGFVSIDWTLIFTWGNLLILYLLLRHFLFKPVQKMLADRENEVKSMYDNAEKAQSEAEKMKAEYTEHLQNAKAEANELLQSANQKATLRSEEMLREAQQKASDMVTRADAQIEEEKKRAFQEVKREISQLAVMAASQVVEKEISQQDHERMIEEFIDGAGDAKWQE